MYPKNIFMVILVDPPASPSITTGLIPIDVCYKKLVISLGSSVKAIFIFIDVFKTKNIKPVFYESPGPKKKYFSCTLSYI